MSASVHRPWNILSFADKDGSYLCLVLSLWHLFFFFVLPSGSVFSSVCFLLCDGMTYFLFVVQYRPTTKGTSIDWVWIRRVMNVCCERSKEINVLMMVGLVCCLDQRKRLLIGVYLRRRTLCHDRWGKPLIVLTLERLAYRLRTQKNVSKHKRDSSWKVVVWASSYVCLRCVKMLLLL